MQDLKESQEIFAKFQIAYHLPTPYLALSQIMKVMTDEIPCVTSEHYKWLEYTCNRLIKESKQETNYELPGMLYGMIYKAFELLLEDYEIYLNTHEPDRRRTFKVVEDLSRYLKSRANLLFFKKDELVAGINIETVLNCLATKAFRVIGEEVTTSKINDSVMLDLIDFLKANEFVFIDKDKLNTLVETFLKGRYAQTNS